MVFSRQPPALSDPGADGVLGLSLGTAVASSGQRVPPDSRRFQSEVATGRAPRVGSDGAHWLNTQYLASLPVLCWCGINFSYICRTSLYVFISTLLMTADICDAFSSQLSQLTYTGNRFTNHTWPVHFTSENVCSVCRNSQFFARHVLETTLTSEW